MESELATDVLIVCIDSSKIPVYREVWLCKKCELGRASAELVCLDAHGGLLRKCNDRLELQCHGLTDTDKTKT